ncbi:hypothetical protein OG788_09510 [Streptomyces sp. NBC_00647]|uniref:hypothetical protein n=1 Tax=Streptomyces sp. NBC_00647 TaxID=2975796 RepID=UPI0032494377
MYRTTTTATLLVTVAVTALSGCMTVQPVPASGSPSAPSGAGVPHPDSKAKPQIVQAPAREALERVGPPRKPSPDEAARHRSTPPPQGPQAVAPVPPPQRSRPAPHAEPRHPKPRVARPPGTSDLPKRSDLCALGRKYGGWTADSPEAVICAKTYGH